MWSAKLWGENDPKKSDLVYLVYKQEDDGALHLYRMILKPDNTAYVEVDEETTYVGELWCGPRLCQVKV